MGIGAIWNWYLIVKIAVMIYEQYEYKYRSGFSFIELLLVIAIIAIIAASSAPFISRVLTQNYLEVSTDKVVSTIRKAQSYAMSSKDNAVWGFCENSSSLRLYKGSCAAPAYYEDFDLSKVVVVGLTDVSFSGSTGNRGEPSVSATVIVSNDAGTNSVSINYAGGLTFD